MSAEGPPVLEARSLHLPALELDPEPELAVALVSGATVPEPIVLLPLDAAGKLEDVAVGAALVRVPCAEVEEVLVLLAWVETSTLKLLITRFAEPVKASVPV